MEVVLALATALVFSPLHLYLPVRLVRDGVEGGRFYGAPFVYAFHGFDVPTYFSASGFLADCLFWTLVTTPVLWWLGRRVRLPATMMVAVLGVGAMASAWTLVAAAELFDQRFDDGVELNPFVAQQDDTGRPVSTGPVELSLFKVRYVFNDDDALIP